jgi:protein-S-isoprenylcysteine O-methyltransferase Ste14
VSDDHTFRAVLIVFLAVVMPIGMYHRIKSQMTREPLDRRQEGLFILSTLRPMGAIFWFALFAWVINPSWMSWSSVTLPAWTRWIGVVVLALACTMLVWTFRSLGRNLTDTVVTRQQHTLVLHGPYRWIRHPLYDSAALLTAAISVITTNWFLLATGAVILGLLVSRTRIEEANLVTRFGDSYRNYMKRTGRFVPRMGAR